MSPTEYFLSYYFPKEIRFYRTKINEFYLKITFTYIQSGKSPFSKIIKGELTTSF